MSDYRANQSSSAPNADDVIASTYHVPSLSSVASPKNSKTFSWQHQSSSCGVVRSSSVAAVAANNPSTNSDLPQPNIVVVGTSLLHTPKVPCLQRRRSLDDDAGTVLLTDVSQSSVANVDNNVTVRNCADTSDIAVSRRNVDDTERRRHCERVTSQQLFRHSPSTVCSLVKSVKEHPASQQTAVSRLDLHEWSSPVVSRAGHFEISTPIIGTARQLSRRKITELLMVRGRSRPTLFRHRSMTPSLKLEQIVEEHPAAAVTPATSSNAFRQTTGRNETQSKTKVLLPASTTDKGNECVNVDESQRHFSIEVEQFLQKVSRVENLLNVDPETGAAPSARFVSLDSHPVRHRNLQRKSRREKASSNYYTASSCIRGVLQSGDSEQNRSQSNSTHKEPFVLQRQPSSSPRLSENDSNRPMDTESLCKKIDIGDEEVNTNGNDAGSRTASMDRNLQRWNIVDLMEALNDDLRLASRVSRVQQAPRLPRQLEQQQISKDLPRPYFSTLTSRSTNRPSTFHLPVNWEKPADNSSAAVESDTRSNTTAHSDTSAVSITTAATVPKRTVLDYRVPENVTRHLGRRQAMFPSLSVDKTTSSLTLPLPPKRSSMKITQHQHSTPPDSDSSCDIVDRRSCVSLPSTLSVDLLRDAERHRSDRRPGRVTWFQPLVNSAKCRDVCESQLKVSNPLLHQGQALNAGRSAYLTSTVATQLRPSSNMWAMGRKLTCDRNAGKGDGEKSANRT